MGSQRAPGGSPPAPMRPRPTPMRPANSGSFGPTCMPPPPTPGRPPPPRGPLMPGMSGAPGGRMPGGTTSPPPTGGTHGRGLIPVDQAHHIQGTVWGAPRGACWWHHIPASVLEEDRQVSSRPRTPHFTPVVTADLVWQFLCHYSQATDSSSLLCGYDRGAAGPHTGQATSVIAHDKYMVM